jgi:predicted GIY-YIG superfamily endonuclease
MPQPTRPRWLDPRRWFDRIAPHARGVYVLHFDDKSVYVGSSVDMQRRIRQHVRGSDEGTSPFSKHTMVHVQWKKRS